MDELIVESDQRLDRDRLSVHLEAFDFGQLCPMDMPRMRTYSICEDDEIESDQHNNGTYRSTIFRFIKI
jgi:hypothetical protein